MRLDLRSHSSGPVFASHKDRERLRRRAAERAEGQVDLVASDGDWEVYIPKTHDAAVYLATLYGGPKPNWVTCSLKDSRWFDAYNKRGPLYVIINKTNGDKYQAQFESDEFCDADDRYLGGIEGLRDFCEDKPGLYDYFFGDEEDEGYVQAASETSGAAMRRRKKATAQEAEEGTVLLATDGDWELYEAKNYPAMLKLSTMYGGGKARWCFAYSGGSQWFDHYTKHGPLYVIVNKSTGEKYAVHLESNSFYDAQDRNPYGGMSGEEALATFCEDKPNIYDYFFEE